MANDAKDGVIEVRDFKPGIQPDSDANYTCIYHPDEILACIRGRIFKFILRAGMAPSHALDLDFICPTCGLKQVWGLPITEEQYDGYEKHTVVIDHEQGLETYE